MKECKTLLYQQKKQRFCTVTSTRTPTNTLDPPLRWPRRCDGLSFFEQTKRLNVGLRRNVQLHVDVTDRLTHWLFYLAVLHVCCYAASYAAHELNWTAVRELEFVFRTKRPSSLSAANHYEVAPGAWTIDAWCNYLFSSVQFGSDAVNEALKFVHGTRHVYSDGIVHSTRTDRAPTVLVSLQPISSPGHSWNCAVIPESTGSCSAESATDCASCSGSLSWTVRTFEMSTAPKAAMMSLTPFNANCSSYLLSSARSTMLQ